MSARANERAPFIFFFFLVQLLSRVLVFPGQETHPLPVRPQKKKGNAPLFLRQRDSSSRLGENLLTLQAEVPTLAISSPFNDGLFYSPEKGTALR